MSEMVVLIGGTWQQALEFCRTEGMPRPNVGRPDSPIWTNDYRRLQGLRIGRLVLVGDTDPDLLAVARTRLR